MQKSTVASVVVHKFNGFADGDDKFVEVDGKKFIDDGTGKPKLDDKQQPIPFIVKQDDKKIELDKLGLEELAEKNPAVKKLLEDKKKADDDAKKASEEEAKKRGDWEKLATEREGSIKDLQEKLSVKDEQLGKYVKSVGTILEEVLKTIPTEKQALIPADYSPRQKLEYITQNAKLLGATIVSKGDKVDKNDITPTTTDEDKLVAEIDVLNKKGATRTQAENTILFEKSKLLKTLRAKKEEAEKNKK